MTIYTKNFHPDTDPKLICTCGKVGCDKRSVSYSVLSMAQVVRDVAGRPLKINSGGRCPKHESEIHRKVPADHQLMQAVDIAVNNGFERGEIVALGIECGFNAIGVADGFVHLGYREEMPIGVIVMWTY